MKKLEALFLFVFLMGCSSAQNVLPTATPGISQTLSLVATKTAIPPTQTLAPTLTLTATLTPTATGGGAGKIAFTSEQNGVTEIYVVNSDGSNLIKLANSVTPKFYPAWSPDGKKIAFGTNTNDSADLYVMNADGSNPTKLLDTKEIPAYYQVKSVLRFA